MPVLKVWVPDTTSWETYTQAKFAERGVQKQVNSYIANAGKARGPLPEIVVQVVGDYPPTDFFTCVTVTIVSTRIKKILESKADHGVQFLPVVVMDREHGPTQDQYFLMNILEAVPCFDWEGSEYNSRLLDNGIRYIDAIYKLVLLPVDTIEHPLFKVADVFQFILCVDDGIAQRILDAGCTGAAFRHPSETRW